MIGVAGGGHVGLATAAGFARLGQSVTLIETDEAKARLLADGCLPFRDPELELAFRAELVSGRVSVQSSYQPGRERRIDVGFICVPTPPAASGVLDAAYVKSAASALASLQTPLIVIRSTVAPGTTESLGEELGGGGSRFAFNPEFLREGRGLEDFEGPGRVVLGTGDEASLRTLRDLFSFVKCPVVETDARTAEVIKLAANAALALRVTTANELARTAAALGANPEVVLASVRLDDRIGSQYFESSIGFGGPCLPKDLKGLLASAQAQGYAADFLSAAVGSNAAGVARLREAVRASTVGGPARVCIVGVAFKPGSDSVTGSLAAELVSSLIDDGFEVRIIDPLARASASELFSDAVEFVDGVDLHRSEPDVVVILNASLAKGLDLGRFPKIDHLGRVTRPVCATA